MGWGAVGGLCAASCCIPKRRPIQASADRSTTFVYSHRRVLKYTFRHGDGPLRSSLRRSEDTGRDAKWLWQRRLGSKAPDLRGPGHVRFASDRSTELSYCSNRREGPRLGENVPRQKLLRIVFSVVPSRRMLGALVVFISSKLRRKFYVREDHWSFHTAWAHRCRWGILPRGACCI